MGQAWANRVMGMRSQKMKNEAGTDRERATKNIDVFAKMLVNSANKKYLLLSQI